MTIKVFINPDYSNVPAKADNGGIRRVAEAMMEHLPKFGIEVVHDINEADVICNHGSMLAERKGIPSVNISHGLYWSRQPWGDGYMEVNAQLVESMAHAVAHTAPSQWVSNAIRRGGYWYPEVVYHGIDGDKFLPSPTHGDYILWNKARADYVSDPQDVMTLAGYMPTVQFHATIGRPNENLKIIGVLSHDDMKKEISEAALYLSTARETFGIGTLEAMAYGVPIVGWDWGGNSEIVKQGVTGYLAPAGDYKALSEMVQLALEQRAILSKNCVEDVRKNWTWEPRIKQYADIFKRIHAQYSAKRPKVSVLVTAYNLDAFLPQCLNSISKQTMEDFECIVIDDAQRESTRILVENASMTDSRIRYVSTPNNFGLVGARNFGFSQAKGEYIRHVDADDWLGETALELEANALDNDRGIHIAYGHMAIVNSDGTIREERAGWPPSKFNWYQQMAHMNQIPSCAMSRRFVFERSGGYRERMKRQEDAEFNCRVTSFGFRAKKVTEAVTYYHRDHADSKGAKEWSEQGAEPDWTAWFPWRLGATDFRTASDFFKTNGEVPKNTYLVPFGAQGKSPMKFWYVHDFYYPVVSVIVTCGPTHKQYLLDALDSIQAQRFIDWECIVVNDTGEDWGSDIMGAPWAKVINMNGNQGASQARNEGLKHAKGKYVIWMDADDIWMPWMLERMVGYAERNDGVIYSDFFMDKNEGELKIFKYHDFQPQFLQAGCAVPGTSILIPKKYADKIKWDEDILGIEDWDYQYQLCDAGACFFHAPEPLFVYRMYSSTKREKDHAKGDIIKSYMDEKWKKYRTGKENLMCGCQKPKPPIGAPISSLSSSGNFTQSSVSANVSAAASTQMVMVEYVGPIKETFSINSIIDRNVRYRFGNNDQHRFKSVFFADAKHFISIRGGIQALPYYRIVSMTTDSPADNPSAFLSQPISA